MNGALCLYFSSTEADHVAELSKALVKRSRKLTGQVEKLGLLATPFGQALRALGLTCDDLRSLWSRLVRKLACPFDRQTH